MEDCDENMLSLLEYQKTVLSTLDFVLKELKENNNKLEKIIKIIC